VWGFGFLWWFECLVFCLLGVVFLLSVFWACFGVWGGFWGLFLVVFCVGGYARFGGGVGGVVWVGVLGVGGGRLFFSFLVSFFVGVGVLVVVGVAWGGGGWLFLWAGFGGFSCLWFPPFLFLVCVWGGGGGCRFWFLWVGCLGGWGVVVWVWWGFGGGGLFWGFFSFFFWVVLFVGFFGVVVLGVWGGVGFGVSSGPVLFCCFFVWGWFWGFGVCGFGFVSCVCCFCGFGFGGGGLCLVFWVFFFFFFQAASFQWISHSSPPSTACTKRPGPFTLSVTEFFFPTNSSSRFL